MADWTLSQYIVLGVISVAVFACIYWEEAWDWIEAKRRAAHRKRSATAYTARNNDTGDK